MLSRFHVSAAKVFVSVLRLIALLLLVVVFGSVSVRVHRMCNVVCVNILLYSTVGSL